MARVDSRDYVLSRIYYSVLEPRRCAKHNVACQHSQQTQDVDPMLVNSGPPSIKPALVQRLVLADSSSSGSAYCWRRLQADTGTMSVKCWASISGAGQYPFSPSRYFMPVGACAHSAGCAAADSDMEVSAYFTSVHITVFWMGCARHCCSQRNGRICLFQKCAYTLFWKGCDMQKRAQWRQWNGSIYLIYKWAHTAFWQHCYTQDRGT